MTFYEERNRWCLSLLQAFARRQGKRAALCVVPRLLLSKEDGWEGHVHVSRDLSRPLLDVVSGVKLRPLGGVLSLSEVFQSFPVAFLAT